MQDSRASFEFRPLGLDVRELEWSELTRAERAAFGLPLIEPIPGLQSHNTDIHDPAVAA